MYFSPDVWQSDYQDSYTNRIMILLKSRKLHQWIAPVFPNHCINLTDRKSIAYNSIISLHCLTERIYEQLMNQALNERVWHYMTKCIIDNYWLPHENIKKNIQYSRENIFGGDIQTYATDKVEKNVPCISRRTVNFLHIFFYCLWICVLSLFLSYFQK